MIAVASVSPTPFHEPFWGTAVGLASVFFLTALVAVGQVFQRVAGPGPSRFRKARIWGGTVAAALEGGATFFALRSTGQVIAAGLDSLRYARDAHSVQLAEDRLLIAMVAIVVQVVIAVVAVELGLYSRKR